MLGLLTCLHVCVCWCECGCVKGVFDKLSTRNWQALLRIREKQLIFTLYQPIKENLISLARQDDKILTNLQTIQYNGCHYRFAVTTIDLDSKSFDKMPFYMEQDREIVQHYKQMVDEEDGQFARCVAGLNQQSAKFTVE